jgi:hypothetical protein
VGSSGFYGRSPDPDEDALDLSRIREIIVDVVRIRAATDHHLTYLDGRELLGVDPDDAALLPDLLHPNQEGMDLMAARFSAALGDLLSGASDAATSTDS